LGLLAGGMAFGAPSVIFGQGAMSREERLRQHRERINKILEERRKQEAANQAANPAGAASAPGGQSAVPPGGVQAGGATAQPGSPSLPPQPSFPVTEAGRPGIPPAQGIPGAPGQPVPGQPGIAQAGGQTAARNLGLGLLALFPFDSSIRVGDTFETEVICDSRSGSFTSVSFTLSWNPEDLHALAMDHSPLATMEVKEFEYGLDPDKGLVSVRVQFPDPTTLSGQPLIKMVWEGLRPAQASEIRFRFDGEVPTGMFSQTDNGLGTPGAGDDGVLHSVVLIRPRLSKTASIRTPDGGLLIGTEGLVNHSGRIRMSLESDRMTLRTGEVAVVGVRLSNPDSVPFDRIRLYLQFDPKQAEILDTDRGNAVRSGVNIREADRDRLTFDYLRTNRADNRDGVVEFDAGNEVKSIETTGGLVAQLALRALRSGPLEISLVRNAQGLGPDTDVLHAGESVLEGSSLPTEPTLLKGLRLTAWGNPVTLQQGLDRTNPAQSTGGSQVLVSSGLAKQRQFGTVPVTTSQESDQP
jgi:hypothetical protein